VIAEGIAPWQWLLDGMGSILAWLYGLVGNYGIAIILLTIVLKIVLLPLAWKQIKNMQHMQAIQPKIKELQKKYKGDKQKQQEMTMKLYRESGVNPLAGCLPMLLLYPFLIAMYQILTPIQLVPAEGQANTFQIATNKAHIPEDSQLMEDILSHQNLDFLWMNMQCTPLTAGTQVVLTYNDDGESKPLPDGDPILGEGGVELPYDATTRSTLDCGSQRFPAAVPYFLTLLLMAGSGFYMQRQTMKNTPQTAQSGSQQAILKYMPVLFGIFGLNFPAGLLVYWTASNLFQVGQQDIMMRMGHIGPDAIEKRIAEQRQRATTTPAKPGLMDRLSARAEDAQKARDAKAGQNKKTQPSKGGPKPKPSPKPAPKKGAAPGNQLKKKPGGGR
jgi:YidC/Oxa1 family membrane protein insertase